MVNLKDADATRVAAVKTHAVVTLLLGALYAVYHALWIGSPEPPFPTPEWYVPVQLSWGFISFGAIFLYQRANRSPVLPALFVTLTGATFSYVWYLEVTRGTVSDELVPTWWKVITGFVGLVLLMEGVRQVRLGRKKS